MYVMILNQILEIFFEHAVFHNFWNNSLGKGLE